MALSDQEILTMIQSEERNAIGLGDESSDLSKQRTKALDYYKGEMDDLNPSDNSTSRVVSRDVFEVVEGALPELIDIFTSADNAMEFTPVGEDDVDAARQETDVINHVFYQENDGFMILYSFIKDGLLSKTGYTKTSYQERSTDEEEHYFEIDDDTLAALRADDEVEITDIKTTTEPETLEVIDLRTGQRQPQDIETKTHDVVLVRKKDKSGVVVEVLAPEDVSVSRRTTRIQDANYVRHEPQEVTRGDLIELGIDKDLVMRLPKSSSNKQNTQSSEKQARDTIQGDDSPQSTENSINEFVDVADNYIRMDVNGNGKPELWHVMTAGREDTHLLEKERIERIPIASWSPVPITHEFFGLSLADNTLDIQRIKTFFERAAVDNAAFQNNMRPIINKNQETDTTIDDVLRNRPGQPVRVEGDARTAISMMPNNNISAEMLAMVRYYDEVRQDRTGVTDLGQGLDPDSLNQASGTATGFTGLMDKSMLRLKLVARIAAEGLKDTFCNIHWQLQKHQDKETAFNLNGEWVQVNPREWKMRTNMRINVGLGTGSKAQQVAALNSTLQNQIFAMQQGTGQTDMGKINLTLRRIAELSGLGDGDQFYNRVSSDTPPPQAPPDAAAIKAQADAQKDAADIQNDQQELQLKAQDQEFNQAFRIQELQVKATIEMAKISGNSDKVQIEASLKDKQLDAEAFLKNKELDQEAEIAGTRFGSDVAKEIGANIRPGGDRL